jgi:hypothetical protein
MREMKSKFLLRKKIEQKLEEIYLKRKTWNGALGPFDESSIKKREAILIVQKLLESLLTKSHEI